MFWSVKIKHRVDGMKISTKGRYGLRIMNLLALDFAESGERYVSITEISKKIGVSKAYLEKLIAILKKNNLVNSERGQSGGYTLARSPSKISVGEILRSLENDLIIAECTVVGCTRNCPGKDIFSELYTLINNHLDTISLEQIANKENYNAKKDIPGQCGNH